MKIKRQVLIDILSSVKPGLAKKGIVEQMTHFVFSGDDVVAYNDKICIVHPFRADFTCSVSAEQFYKILNGIQVEEIDLSFKDDKLKITAKGINSGLVTDTGEDILDKMDLLNIDAMSKKAKPLPKDFLDGIELCMFSASKDQTNPTLTCLLIEDRFIASTDDLRISEYQMKSKMNCSILLPAISAFELIKFKVDKYALADNLSWVYFFDKNGVVFCSRLLAGEFPDYIKFFDGFDKKEIKLPKELVNMILTASVLVEGEIDVDKEIQIEIVGKELKVSGSNQLGSWVESIADMPAKIGDIKFAINPLFLTKVLNYTQSMFYGGNKALFESGEFRHIIALKAEE